MDNPTIRYFANVRKRSEASAKELSRCLERDLRTPQVVATVQCSAIPAPVSESCECVLGQ